MDWLPYLILGFIASILVFQGYIWLHMRRLQGRPIDGLEAIPGVPKNPRSNRLLFYFFTLQCAHCRAMAPIVDSLVEQNDNVIKINTMEHLELARQLGITGVPSFLVVDRGAVSKVLLGVQPRERLEQLLQA